MQNIKTRTLTRVAVATAAICILGPLALPIPISPVPISLTHFAIYGAVYALGKKKGTLSVLLYLLIGAIGVPVFSGFAGGVGKLAGPTGGYLLGFAILAFVLGSFVDKKPDDWKFQGVGMLLGNGIVYLFGTLWLMISTGMTFTAALMVGVVPYLVFDIIKAVIALIIGPKLRHRLGESA